MTRVLVVDDSQFMRTVVGNALTKAGFDVTTATDGADAVDAVASSDPDVVTMDVEMPVMDGLEAVERIMSTNPTPILMVSSYTERGAEATLDAMERGAVDCLHKPDGSGSRNLADLTAEVVERVEALATANVSSFALARASAAVHATGPGRSVPAVAAGGGGHAVERTSESEPVVDVDEDACVDDPTIVVGASTGGPKIVERLFATLPIDLGAKLLLVQHMPADFTGRLASRLDRISEYAVSEASDGDRVRPGEALVASGGYHLEVASNVSGRLRVRLTEDDRLHGVRPAIDVTMRTAAERVDDPLVGVVLTGMGRDGAAGVEAIKDAGGRTIAQDEATSPVFGIPCQAIETGCVDDVRPADEIVDGILDAVRADGETYG